MLSLTLAAWLSTTFAASPAALTEIDQLYLRRDQPKKLEQSISQLQDAVKADPSDAALQWRLGRSLIALAAAKPDKEARLAVFAQAEDALKKAVKLDPDDARAHYWLAREMGGENEIRRKLGLARSMKRELETALKLDSKLADAHQTYGELLHQLPGFVGGDKKKGVAELEEALRLSPNETGRYQPLAEGYLDIGEKQKAVDVLRKIFDVKTPDDPGSAAADLRDARALLDKLTGGKGS